MREQERAAAEAAAALEAASAPAPAPATASAMMVETGEAARATADEECRLRALLDKAVQLITREVGAECCSRSVDTSYVDVVFTHADGRVSFPTTQCAVPRAIADMGAERLGTAIVDGLGRQALAGACSAAEFTEACKAISLRMVAQFGQEHQQEAV